MNINFKILLNIESIKENYEILSWNQGKVIEFYDEEFVDMQLTLAIQFINPIYILICMPIFNQCFANDELCYSNYIV